MLCLALLDKWLEFSTPVVLRTLLEALCAVRKSKPSLFHFYSAFSLGKSKKPPLFPQKTQNSGGKVKIPRYFAFFPGKSKKPPLFPQKSQNSGGKVKIPRKKQNSAEKAKFLLKF